MSAGLTSNEAKCVLRMSIKQQDHNSFSFLSFFFFRNSSKQWLEGECVGHGLEFFGPGNLSEVTERSYAFVSNYIFKIYPLYMWVDVISTVGSIGR